ncbi:LexA family transcriptional regulator [Achromobacter marplatensis]|uniref:Peptidase S24/S26A/S26B/S26C domain-containing protein n=1 Tax=Achromobacter marplatensis TaxID=470868 RepID=A0AA42WDR8_9BURK|nr:LexA family transcriptional regulator [Achromobacter marplatensis]MDH2052553.1 hypothetical protein [Achromobacter marplatensis]
MDRSKNRLKKVHQLVEAAGGQARFAEIVGISPSQAWQIAGSTPVRGIGSKMAARIEQAFDKPAGWLDWPADAPPMTLTPVNHSPQCNAIPILTHAAEIAEFVTGAVNAQHECSATMAIDGPASELAFGFEIQDLSMAPQFQPGDRIIIDPRVAPVPGSHVVAILRNSIVLFAKYRPHDLEGGATAPFDLVPLNEDFPSFHSDRHDTVVIGTAIEHRRNLR